MKTSEAVTRSRAFFPDLRLAVLVMVELLIAWGARPSGVARADDSSGAR